MSAVMCPSCGGSNPAGAAFCQYCGTAISTQGSAPLPTYAAPTPSVAWGPPMGGMAAPPAPPPPRRRSRLLMVLVVIVAVVLVLGVVAYFLVPAAPSIQITLINFDSPDNVCGLDQATSNGFNASTGQVVNLQFDISGNATSGGGTLGCTISSLTTSTSGFALSNESIPLVVPVNEVVLLNFNVQCPGSSYTGPLTLVLT